MLGAEGPDLEGVKTVAGEKRKPHSFLKREQETPDVGGEGHHTLATVYMGRSRLWTWFGGNIKEVCDNSKEMNRQFQTGRQVTEQVLSAIAVECQQRVEDSPRW